MHANYFEGTLQLRNPTEEVLNYVEASGAQVSRIKEVIGGLDYYFVSQRVLRALGTDLKRRFPGEMKMSRRLFSRDHFTQKVVYRVTVLFRCYNIKKGDAVTIRGKDYMVLSAGKKVFVQQKKTGEKKWVDYSALPSQLRES